MTTVELTAEEWEKAMAFIVASKEDPNQTATGAPPLNYANEGKAWSQMQPPVGQNKNFMEVPPSGPADNGVKNNPLAPGKEIGTPTGFSIKVGTPQSTGTPTGSFAKLHESDTSKGWSSQKGKPTGKVYTNVGNAKKLWTAFPKGKQPKNQTPDGPTTISKLNLAPRTTMAHFSEDTDPDPDNSGVNRTSLPDGSFLITNGDDIHNAVAKVQNMEQANPNPKANPWYTEIKKHIAQSARRLDPTHNLGYVNKVPADWQMMMASEVAELEALLAHKYEMSERRALAKKGWALPDGSYPIADAEDLGNAVILARSGHGDVSAAKKLIAKRAKELGKAVPAGI